MPLRIGHVSDSYLPKLGGMEIQVTELATRQHAAGHDVRVITASRADDAPPGTGPEVHRLVGATAPRVARLGAPVAAGRAVLDGGFDVVHAHVGVGSPVGFAAAATAATAGIPTVVTVHSIWAGLHALFRAIDGVAAITTLPIIWTAVSEVAAAPVRRLLPPGTPVSVLPNGVDPAAWAAPALPRDPGTVTVVAVMRLTARKRILPLLRILRLAHTRTRGTKKLQAVIVGDGLRRGAAQRHLDRYGLTDSIRLTGSMDRSSIARLHRSADVFIAPADLESFGIAALEARCAGLPVLAKAGSGVGEFVRHGREGLLASDDDELVDHLVRLTTDDNLRAALQHHNRSTPSPITWPTVLDEAESAYRKAIAGYCSDEIQFDRSEVTRLRPSARVSVLRGAGPGSRAWRAS